jgi:hypothetical protein
MVIVDLTDPFVDGGFAAAIFDIVVGLFVESKLSTGKILVFDEAHKVWLILIINNFLLNITQSTLQNQMHLNVWLTIYCS